MSIDAYVYFQRQLLPSADVWNVALAGLHWDVRFPPGLDVRSASGFQRGYFRGRRTGAEMYFGDLSSADRRSLGLTNVDRSVQFSFTYALEAAFVLAVGYALCQLAKGIYFDPQSGQVVGANQLRAQVIALLNSAPKLSGPEW